MTVIPARVDSDPEFVGCARCWRPVELGMHPDIEWKPLTHPIPDSDGTTWTHFAICPDTNEPILMRRGPKA